MSVPKSAPRAVIFPSKVKWPAILRIAASVTAAVFLAAFSFPVSAQEPINIEKWSDDVPCDKLKKSADGTYEMTVPWARFYTIHTRGTWKNTRETAYWDQKCKGKTQ